MSYVERLSGIQLHLDSLEEIEKKEGNNPSALNEIEQLRESLNELSNDIKTRLLNNRPSIQSAIHSSFKDQILESEERKETLDDETITWLDENYGSNYQKATILISPRRSPLQKFRSIGRMLANEGTAADTHSDDSAIKNNIMSSSAYQLTEIAMIVPNVDKILQTCWDLNTFNIFDLAAEPGVRGHTLLVFCSYLSKQFGWIKEYHLPLDKFHNFLFAIENAYNDIPYHNQLHAADVTHVMMHLCKTSLFRKNMTSLDMLCAFLSAVIHDVAHTGQTNNYHINSSSFLAIRYNDKSVLENFHLSTAFSILKDPKNNFLKNLTNEEKKYFRSTVIKMVLGTDLHFHQTQLNKLKKFVSINSENKDTKNNEINFKIYSSQNEKPRIYDVFNEKLFIMETALHLSDISNPTKNINVAIEWTNRITAEFFAQGDMEKLQGIEISPMCDRNKNNMINLAKQSLGFIDFIVYPMYNLFNNIEPEINKFIQNIKNTRKYWHDVQCEKQMFPPINRISSNIPNQNNEELTRKK